MRALTSLVLKELRQHALVGLALAVVLGLAYAIVLLGALANDTVTVLEAHGSFARLILPVVAIFLGQRLVVTEYFGRTFQFLEALPVRRGQLLAVKAGLFALTLAVAAVGSQALMFAVASARETIDGAYFGVVLVRTLAWTLFLFAYFLSTSLAGRFCVPLYGLTGLLVWALDSLARLDPTDYGPLALVDHTFVLERRVLPIEPLVTTLSASAALLLIAVVLALGRSGTLAADLAGRLSARERSAVGGVLIAAILLLSTIDQEPERLDPVAAGPGWLVSETPRLRVYHGAPAREADARRVFAVVAQDLVALAPVVGGADALPTVHVLLHAGLGPDEALPESHGEDAVAVVRAPPTAAPSLALRAAIVEQTLLARTAGRSDFEPSAWLAPAFARWLAARDAATVDPEVVQRALFATRGGRVTDALLRNWHRTRERLGEPVATALAETGLHALAARHGPHAVLALAHALFDRPVRTSSLTVLDELVLARETRFARATGIAWPVFLGEWNAWLAAQRRAVGDRGTKVRATLESTAGPGAIRSLRARVGGSADGVRLRHAFVGAYEHALRDADLEVHASELAGRYAPGDIIFAAIEIDDPALGCAARLFARRLELR